MLKVIVVEDENIIRKGLISTTNWLEMNCTIIGEASDGIEGLELVKKYEVDIVITDIKMPRMDGITMIKEARKFKVFESIILTSYEEFDYAKEAIKLQVFDYLLKPIDEELLKETLNKLTFKIVEKERLRQINKFAKEKEDLPITTGQIYFEKPMKQHPQVSHVLDEIRDHYNKRLSIEKMAEDMGVSSSYLSRKFKQVTGHTFVDVLNRYRIQKATQLLLGREYRIYEVSDLVGFTEYKSFCIVFKKYVGVSPTDFMNNQVIVCKCLNIEEY